MLRERIVPQSEVIRAILLEGWRWGRTVPVGSDPLPADDHRVNVLRRSGGSAHRTVIDPGGATVFDSASLLHLASCERSALAMRLRAHTRLFSLGRMLPVRTLTDLNVDAMGFSGRSRH